MQSLTPPRTASAAARVPDGTRVYAVGDVHGRLDLLDRLLASIEEDAQRPAPARVAVVFVGDYVDRGPESRGVVERLMAGPQGGLAGADWICLRGNHEDYMVRFLTEVAVGHAWCMNGGLATVRSYAGEAATEGAEGDMAALQLVLARALPPAHLRWLTRLRLTHVEGDYLFVHAGIRPGVALDAQDPHDLLWIRDDFLYDPRPLGKVVVHGHTPGPIPEMRANRIGIDTGAYRSDVLTALVLEGADRRFLTS
ncbi:MAG: metallophosphoesterase family protein [Solirubrobacterales bacterium]